MDNNNLEQITFGGGCFWCVESCFNMLKGVQSAVSGYSGGHKDHPTYEEVCTGETGHAEVVQITYDPAVISYEQLMDVFFSFTILRSLTDREMISEHNTVLLFITKTMRKRQKLKRQLKNPKNPEDGRNLCNGSNEIR
jgi:methionine-S-sulfoxide reductase